MARYEPTHDALTLLAVAAQVLRSARPHEPDRVTQREYDAARVSSGHAATPRADKLAARFGVSWPVLRDCVVNSDHPSRALAIATKRQIRRVLTTAEAVSAVQRAAAYLGSEELAFRDYDGAREALMARATSRHTHAQHLIPMPRGQVISRKFKFSEIVAAAGLRSPKAPATQGLRRTEAIRVFIEHYGFMPRKEDVEWFGRTHGIQLITAMDDQHGPASRAARDHFVADGRWFPPLLTRKLVRPDGWERYGDGSHVLSDLATRYPRRRASDEGYTLTEVREAIAQTWTALPPTQPLTVQSYKTYAREHGLPHYNTANRVAKNHGLTFVGLVRDEAEARSRRAR